MVNSTLVDIFYIDYNIKVLKIILKVIIFNMIFYYKFKGVRKMAEENKMGVMPISKLLITMSLPIMISMLIQALYNIVDSMFVAQINEDALTAVSLAFPIQNLMIAVATGTGVGINALLSRSLGEKNREQASAAANNGIFLAILSGIAFLIIGILFSRPFFEMQNAGGRITEYGITYMTICCSLSIGVFLQITFERILQATGRTVYTMITQGTGAIINIIMDPILIFGLFGAPKLGVAGAAIATVFGQVVAMSLAVYFNHRINHDIDLHFRSFRPSLKIIGKIYRVGIPSIIMASISSVMTFGMNQILLTFTKTSAAFFGVYIKLQSFVFMPIFGLNNGLVPIVSYNYGAQNRKRILKSVQLATCYALVIMTVGLILFESIPQVLLGIFNPSQEMLRIGVPGLRIIATHFIIAAISIVLSTTFQALNQSSFSLIISIARQLFVLLPVAYFMSRTGNINLVWLSYPIAEVVSLILCLFFFKKIYDEKIKHIPDGADH